MKPLIDIRTRWKHDHALQNVIRELCEAGVVKWSNTPFTLKSGIKSHIYVFGREDLTDTPRLGRALGRLLANTVGDHLYLGNDRLKPLCAIGIPTAGTAFAAAMSYSPSRYEIAYRIMREAQKEYGAHKKTWVNGRAEESVEYFTIDNVITDGTSKLEAIEHLEEDGYPARSMTHVTFIDRQQGGMERLVGQGYRAVKLFDLSDLLWAFSALNLWTNEQLDAFEQEIERHRQEAV